MSTCHYQVRLVSSRGVTKRNYPTTPNGWTKAVARAHRMGRPVTLLLICGGKTMGRLARCAPRSTPGPRCYLLGEPSMALSGRKRSRR